MAYAWFKLSNLITPIRVSKETEIEGLDGPEMGALGYPDFTVASECNSVVNSAPSVDFSPGTGSPPSFSGGTVVDGLYVASKAEAWGTTTGTGRRLTLVVAGNGSKIFWAGDVLSGTTTSSFRANTTVSVSGNQLLQTTTCSTGTVTIPSA